MTATDTPLHIKDDIFGVCRRLGEDFGFNPNILRIALAVGLIWSIEGVFAAYAVLGLIVLVSRIVAPAVKTAIVADEATAIPPTASDAQDVAPVEYAKAA